MKLLYNHAFSLCYFLLFVAAHKTGGAAHNHGEHNHDSHAGHSHAVSASETASILAIHDECLELVELDLYDIGLHAAALVVLVIVSLMGSVSPILLKIMAAKRAGRSYDVANLFFVRCGVLFGAGTILATGFIHMYTAPNELTYRLIGAIQNLTHECIPEFFRDYPSWAGLFAMLSMLLVHLIQFLMTSYYERNNSVIDTKIDSKPTKVQHSHHHGPIMPTGENPAKRITVMILEIGIALGVSTGSEFTSLFIALCFHQFFEGLALGSTIVEANFASNLKSLLMGGVYAVTTPLGIAIGMAIHSSYNENSELGLIVQGIFDSCSAGILIYTALVEFLASDISNSVSFRQQSGWKQFVQFCCVYLGVATMAIIGKYA